MTTTLTAATQEDDAGHSVEVVHLTLNCDAITAVLYVLSQTTSRVHQRAYKTNSFLVEATFVKVGSPVVVSVMDGVHIKVDRGVHIVSFSLTA